MQQSQDHSDIQAALAGDGGAYARIIRRYEQQIARRMMGFTRDRNMIEELTHEVFVQAYFGLGKYRSDAPLEHWLQRIATRTGYAFWKQRARQKNAPLEAAVDVASTELSNANALLEVLDQLPPRDRLVLRLLHVDGLSVAQAADLTGWSSTMIKVQAFRARKKFAVLLEKNQFDLSGVS